MEQVYCLLSEVDPTITNSKGALGLVVGNHKFCVLTVCISKVGVMTACGLDSLQLVLGSISWGCLLWGLSIPFLKLFEWVWATCCRSHSWDFVVCIYLGKNC